MIPKPSKKLTFLGLLKKLGYFKKPTKGIFPLLILIFVALSIYFQSELSSDSNKYTVSEVIDGDTVTIKGFDASVRYLGIDTPEILTEDSPGDPLAEKARNLNRRIVNGSPGESSVSISGVSMPRYLTLASNHLIVTVSPSITSLTVYLLLSLLNSDRK